MPDLFLLIPQYDIQMSSPTQDRTSSQNIGCHMFFIGYPIP